MKDFSKYDQMYYFATEAELPESTIIAKAKKLFPLFTGEDFNDKRITKSFVDSYCKHRGLGLSIVEVANSLDVSATLISRVHNGEGLSLERLIDFCKAEAFAIAKLKSIHLARIESTQGMGASVTFLEKAYSKLYGDRKAIDINTGFAEEEDDDVVTFEIHEVANKLKESADQRAQKA